MGNNFFTIAILIFNILLICVYFSKKRVTNFETTTYKYLVISNMISSVLAIGSYLTIKYMEYVPVLNEIVSKSLLVSYLIWLLIFTSYLIGVSDKRTFKVNNIFKTNIIKLICLMFFVAISVCPLNYHNENNIIYSYGIAANIVYALTFLMVILWFVIIIKNRKKLLDRKYYPLYGLLIFGTIVVIIQRIKPELLLLTYLIGFITFLMYFTIENPDIKLINELELAKDNLENANSVKSEFLRSMSHEIRTPMNQIIGCASVIEMEDNLSKESKDVLNDLVNSTNSLLDVCNGIINVSQIESGNVDILISGYNPKEIIEDLVNLNRKRLTNKDIEIVSNYSELPDVVYGDKDKVKQIVSNLLSNAIKYTDKGKIEISVSGSVKKDKCDIEIVVKDTGKGISEDNIDLIFNKFGKLEKNSDTLGLGLGLFITKNLVNILGGNISVTSELGKGSEFKVVLQENLVDTSTKLDLSSVNLMIIHSSNMIRTFLKNSIMKYEIKVNDFSNGVDAINELKKVDYDIVIVDKYISDVRVEELVRTIKEDISSNIKIMVIGNQENIDYVDMFISEELNMNDIINNIKKVLS